MHIGIRWHLQRLYVKSPGCPGEETIFESVFPVPLTRGQHAEQVMVWMEVVFDYCCSWGQAAGAGRRDVDSQSVLG